MAELPKPLNHTIAAIYADYEQKQANGYRNHLGASGIGASCDRAIWYGWRWTSKARHSGRLLRLFETGHMAEDRFIHDLRRIGVTVMARDPETGEQWTVKDDTGHFGGSMDAVAVGIIESPAKWHLCEFKTHNAKSFASLVKDGVEKAKPQHWVQMQVYMHFSGLERAYYMAVNKDTDELYGERIRYNAEAALRIVAKAHRIIASASPPSRISNDASWYECRFCDHKDKCHGTDIPDRHCRSCLHSTPVENGEWRCERHSTILTPENQRAGCAAHLYIPALIPGEQIDAGEDWILYKMPDGEEWKDGISNE